MRKQKRWIGVTAITGVTIVALTASVIIKKNLTNDVNEVINITEEGTNLGIKQIEVVTDKDGNVSGYKVNVETKGFGTDPIVMAVSFNATADEVTGLEIISHSETDGYGARITEDAFLSQFTGLKLPVYIDGMNVGTEKEPDKAEEVETNTNNNEATQLVDGTYEVKAKEASNGWTSQVSLTVAGGVITDVVWDAVNEAGEKKSVQSMNGQYVMTDNGPTWAEQAEALAAYVIENQTVDTLNLLDGGKTDTVASVSISITEFVDGVKECLELASGTTAQTLSLKDGTYDAVGKEDHGWTSEVSVTVKDGKITNVVWDSVDANGNKKSVQSMNGEYVMTDNGPTWAEQAEALAAYVIENQSLSGITLNEEGKTDAVASVSIAITDFVDLVGNCLEQASGTAVDTVVTDEKEDNKSEESNEDSKEETTVGTKVDAVSGATISTKAVLTGINNAFEYLQRTVVK